MNQASENLLPTIKRLPTKVDRDKLKKTQDKIQSLFLDSTLKSLKDLFPNNESLILSVFTSGLSKKALNWIISRSIGGIFGYYTSIVSVFPSSGDGQNIVTALKLILVQNLYEISALDVLEENPSNSSFVDSNFMMLEGQSEFVLQMCRYHQSLFFNSIKNNRMPSEDSLPLIASSFGYEKALEVHLGRNPVFHILSRIDPFGSAILLDLAGVHSIANKKIIEYILCLPSKYEKYKKYVLTVWHDRYVGVEKTIFGYVDMEWEDCLKVRSMTAFAEATINILISCYITSQDQTEETFTIQKFLQEEEKLKILIETLDILDEYAGLISDIGEIFLLEECQIIEVFNKLEESYPNVSVRDILAPRLLRQKYLEGKLNKNDVMKRRIDSIYVPICLMELGRDALTGEPNLALNYSEDKVLRGYPLQVSKNVIRIRSRIHTLEERFTFLISQIPPALDHQIRNAWDFNTDKYTSGYSLYSKHKI